MNTPIKEMSTPSAGSDPLRLFPLEIWDMVIEQLKSEESSQHLSRLAQTCHTLYQRSLPFLYGTVRLAHSESGARLAVAIEQRPELAKLIREIRHKEDSGSELSSGRHFKFYKMAAGLPDLRTLVLRRNPRPPKEPGSYLRTADWAEDPPDTSVIPFDYARGDETLFWHALLQNPPGLPALRTCHIGSDFNHDLHNVEMDNASIPEFNEAIFRHPGLRTLCITGAAFQWVESNSLTHTDTPIQELTLLNCSIQEWDLKSLLKFPKALKKLTLRLPRICPPDFEEYDPQNDYPSALQKQWHSLEYIDYDLYWGGDDMANFSRFTNLKHLTVSLASLSSQECLQLVPEDEILPRSLESLTIRYDEVKPWVPSYIHECVESDRLPNLRLVTCEIPEYMSHLPSAFGHKLNPPAMQVCQEINTWQSALKKFNVELRAIIAPYPLAMPKYETCACECLPFFHRMFYHARPDMHLPWEGNEQMNVFYDSMEDVDEEDEEDYEDDPMIEYIIDAMHDQMEAIPEDEWLYGPDDYDWD
ncbi:hypothetical protein N7535_006725 [Penicillium sp. DV-2018c]|nr:hypothetical protein N7535_006725 [Penicillium sp. DV-2018c]